MSFLAQQERRTCHYGLYQVLSQLLTIIHRALFILIPCRTGKLEKAVVV